MAEVRDKGKGFVPERTFGEGRGLGIMGMQERAVMVGGRLDVISQPGEGSCITVRIPWEISAEVERV